MALRALPDYDALYGVVFDPAPTDPTATDPTATDPTATDPTATAERQ